MMDLEALLFSLSIHAFPNASLFLGERILNGFPDILVGIVLLVIGLLVIAVVIAAAIVLLPAIIIAALVWLLTGSFFYAGIAFLLVAVVWLVAISED
jgi:hypothetical protein